jgi:hypothetical protein
MTNGKSAQSDLVARSILVLLLLLTSAPAIRPQPRVDKNQLAARVRSEFLHAWNGYKKYAWGHDDLKPLSKGYHDWYEQPLLMTPVDALDTMILMDLRDEAKSTREHIVQNLSFDKDIYVQNFEITIRFLGGLLSSYELTGDRRLLSLAEDLGTRLLPAFDSPTGLPYRFVNLKTGKTRGAETNPAEAGTLLVEFGTLSKLTHKSVFYDKAKRAQTEIFKRRSPIGLVGTWINVETGKWTNTDSHISGAIDSYYEYLLKGWLLFRDEDCPRMWQESLAAVNTYLPVYFMCAGAGCPPIKFVRATASKKGKINLFTLGQQEAQCPPLAPSTPGAMPVPGRGPEIMPPRAVEPNSKAELWYGHADMNTGKRTATVYGALDAFFPAELALSGDLERAKLLHESSFKMWSRYGIEPEEINYLTMEVTSPGYPLRPEIVESTYYLYHYTRDPRYLEMGRVMFEDFVKYCRTDEGYAALESVVTKEKTDSMQSFLFAETFKYFYLLFSPPGTLNFDKVIFNTEAHPMRRR